MAARRRLDAELVRRGLVSSREQASRLITESKVLVGGAIADKPARQVDPGQAIELLGPPPPYVSRAGGKLAGALDHFGIDPSGWRVLDAGSSTGGFTDCLRQRGADTVFAVDVGTHQLHERVRADPHVMVFEQTDIRSVQCELLGGPVDAVVGDLSFISLAKVLPALVACARPGAPLLLLVKPQFEAGRQEVSRGKGVISDPETWRRVLAEVADSADAAGAPMVDVVRSSVVGTTGNVEFVGYFIAGADGIESGELSERIDAAVRSATAEAQHEEVAS